MGEVNQLCEIYIDHETCDVVVKDGGKEIFRCYMPEANKPWIPNGNLVPEQFKEAVK